MSSSAKNIVSGPDGDGGYLSLNVGQMSVFYRKKFLAPPLFKDMTKLGNLAGEHVKFDISFRFSFNSLDLVIPQIQRSGLQGTMLKKLVYIINNTNVLTKE